MRSHVTLTYLLLLVFVSSLYVVYVICHVTYMHGRAMYHFAKSKSNVGSPTANSSSINSVLVRVTCPGNAHVNSVRNEASIIVYMRPLVRPGPDQRSSLCRTRRRDKSATRPPHRRLIDGRFVDLPSSSSSVFVARGEPR